MHKVHYYKGLILKCLFLLAMTVGAMHYTEGAGFAIIIPLAFISLTRDKPEEFYFYLMLFCIVVVTNPRIAKRGVVFFLEQRVVLMSLGFIFMLRLFGQNKNPLVVPFAGLIWYLVYMAVSSLFGWNVVVSYLKLALFLFVFLAYFYAANMAAQHPRENLPAVRSVILSIAIFFIIGSVAVIPFPSIGLMNAEMLSESSSGDFTSLFMGMAAHSQCLGPIISALAVLIFADLIFGIREWNWIYIILLVCCPILIWKTSSRTAMGTFISGLLFSSYLFMKTRWVGNHWKKKVMSVLWIGGIFFVIAILFSGLMRERAVEFLQKGKSEGGKSANVSIETIISSRKMLYDNAIKNFEKSPILGNGFQVSEEMETLKVRSFTSILSAPIEKGVWVSAILEEGGLIGFAIFCAVVWNILSKMIKYRGFITASVFLVFIVSNLGEFTIFSMSYVGGFMWALVFAAVALDATRSRADFYAEQALLQKQIEEEQMLNNIELVQF